MREGHLVMEKFIMRRVLLVMSLSSLALFPADAMKRTKTLEESTKTYLQDSSEQAGLRKRKPSAESDRASERPGASKQKYSPLIEENPQEEDTPPTWFQEGEKRFGEWLAYRAKEEMRTNLASITAELSSCKTENGFRVRARIYGITGDDFIQYIKYICDKNKERINRKEKTGWTFNWEK